MDKLQSESGYIVVQSEIAILDIAKHHALLTATALREAAKVHYIETQEPLAVLDVVVADIEMLLAYRHDQADEWDDGRPYPRMPIGRRRA